MNFRTGVDVSGTHLVGQLDTTYHRLVEVFGEPEDGDGEKTRKEWTIQFEDGTVATIYDWKKTEEVESVVEWNVGGKDGRALELVYQAMDQPKTKTYLATIEIDVMADNIQDAMDQVEEVIAQNDYEIYLREEE